MVRRRPPDPRTSCTRWDQVSGHDVQRWLVHLLTRYSDAYASNQFRALQQCFRWLAEEEQLPDPVTRLRSPKVSEKLVPVFTSEELLALEKTCQGRSFVQRRDAAMIAVLTATRIRAGELAGIRYDAGDPRRSDVDLWRREITVCGKGGRPVRARLVAGTPGCSSSRQCELSPRRVAGDMTEAGDRAGDSGAGRELGVVSSPRIVRGIGLRRSCEVALPVAVFGI